MKDWKRAICDSHANALVRFRAEKEGLAVTRERPIDERIFSQKPKEKAE